MPYEMASWFHSTHKATGAPSSKKVLDLTHLLERLECFPPSSNPQGSLKILHDEQIGRFPSHLTFFRRQVLHACIGLNSMQVTVITGWVSTDPSRT
jgi:hypothetical protein